jgi:DNA primase large subunit
MYYTLVQHTALCYAALQIMTVDQFTKQYAYNVRHMYGKEGKRTNYTPYSCLKIIMSAGPGGGEHHGCPYRHNDESHLSSLLGQLRLDREDRDAMLGHVRNKGYQLACQRHFEASHKGYEEEGVNADGVGNHPNAWMAASMQYYKAKDSASGSSKAGATAAVGSSSSGSTGAAAAAAGAGVSEADAAAAMDI